MEVELSHTKTSSTLKFGAGFPSALYSGGNQKTLQLSSRISFQVDPIVASFSGGAVGVISALMVVEINNVKQQEHKRCKYCLGTGSLACARCSSTGTLVLTEPVSTADDGGNQPLSLPKTERCSNCSGAGKVRHIIVSVECLLHTKFLLVPAA
ncbi:hypothetical protein DVH24_024511 [Malus domestica]|uniref:Uncharacterized protein n=1 Tax=Malus domestica TaxID=3750 RepID=A0A498JIX1_MALDO|nr:hypothetical protein DVH24_024511 [Malus domestica]